MTNSGNSTQTWRCRSKTRGCASPDSCGSAGHWLKAWAKSPEQRGWDISHVHHENKAPNQMVSEARDSGNSFSPLPTPEAEGRRKSLAVLQRLKNFICQTRFCYWFGEEGHFLWEKENVSCNCPLRHWCLRHPTSRSGWASESLLETTPDVHDVLRPLSLGSKNRFLF